MFRLSYFLLQRYTITNTSIHTDAKPPTNSAGLCSPVPLWFPMSCPRSVDISGCPTVPPSGGAEKSCRNPRELTWTGRRGQIPVAASQPWPIPIPSRSITSNPRHASPCRPQGPKHALPRPRNLPVRPSWGVTKLEHGCAKESLSASMVWGGGGGKKKPPGPNPTQHAVRPYLLPFMCAPEKDSAVVAACSRNCYNGPYCRV